MLSNQSFKKILKVQSLKRGFWMFSIKPAHNMKPHRGSPFCLHVVLQKGFKCKCVRVCLCPHQSCQCGSAARERGKSGTSRIRFNEIWQRISLIKFTTLGSHKYSRFYVPWRNLWFRRSLNGAHVLPWIENAQINGCLKTIGYQHIQGCTDPEHMIKLGWRR